MRWDIIYGDGSTHLEPHFCREWEDGEGCYGTNEAHGFSWDEACAEICAYHKHMIEWWLKATPDDIGYGNNDDEDDGA